MVLKKKINAILKIRDIIGADNNSLVNLDELVYHFNGLTVPCLNPFSRVPISNLISSDEITR